MIEFIGTFLHLHSVIKAHNLDRLGLSSFCLSFYDSLYFTSFLSFTGSTALVGSGLWFFCFMIILQTVGQLGRVISSSQGLYLNTGQHKHRINTYQTSMPWVGFKLTILGFRASKDSTCLRPLGYRDLPFYFSTSSNSVPFITAWEPDTDHCHQGFYYALRECVVSETMYSFLSNGSVF
jgi:hypothetical protein